jgi:hypothetical protein
MSLTGDWSVMFTRTALAPRPKYSSGEAQTPSGMCEDGGKPDRGPGIESFGESTLSCGVTPTHTSLYWTTSVCLSCRGPEKLTVRIC